MYGTAESKLTKQVWKRAGLTLMQQIRDAIRTRDFVIASVVPSMVYLAILMVYSYGSMQAPAACGFLSLASAAAALGCFSARSKGPKYMALSLSLLVATTLGTALGLYNYDSHTIFPRFYQNSRTYENVVPAEPAAAVADAGKLIFTPESFVSTHEAAGYITESGYTYCAAPIRDGRGAQNVEFWAVGIDCCGAKGTFRCDSAADPKSHAGAVVFENYGLFRPTRHDLYHKARLKAMAEFGLQSTAEPLYIRWVSDSNLDYLSHYYGSQARALEVVTTLLFGCGFAALAYILVPIVPGEPLRGAKRP